MDDKKLINGIAKVIEKSNDEWDIKNPYDCLSPEDHAKAIFKWLKSKKHIFTRKMIDAAYKRGYKHHEGM